MRISDGEPEKPGWMQQIFSNRFGSQAYRGWCYWTRQSGRDVTPKMVEWMLAELMCTAGLFKRTGLVTTFNPAVVKSDTAIPTNLQAPLRKAVLLSKRKTLRKETIGVDDCWSWSGRGEVFSVRTDDYFDPKGNHLGAWAEYRPTSDPEPEYNDFVGGRELEYHIELEKCWCRRVIKQPEPEGDFQPPGQPSYPDVCLREEFRDHGLQVIVKLANIEPTPDKPQYEGGSWHIEGQLNEHICATAIYYYSNEKTTQSSLSFRQRGQDDYDWVTYEQNEHSFLQSTKPGHRKMLALFLVDPPYCIISSANVPPQRADWWGQRQESSAGGLDGEPIT
ncbi:hypothetical protein BDV29DRAFT_189079 [Aspergillus leporis]|uniref:DUF4246 domain-containing protein n=1 Tax=Aspergillus leporis TaxID=41062 RepID=A0A5N5X7Z9_9EURO|nr:hypothetical protein BDV29DRAFT_189079 [Aspergillus leporis]